MTSRYAKHWRTVTCVFSTFHWIRKDRCDIKLCVQSAEDRQKMVAAERTFTDAVHEIVKLKKQVCTEENGKIRDH